MPGGSGEGEEGMSTGPVIPSCDLHRWHKDNCPDCVAEKAAHEERHIRAREDLLRLRVPAETDWLDS